MPIDLDINSGPDVIEGWRLTKKNNKSWLTWKLRFVATVTDERFLPRILVNLGFFESSSQVKKNQGTLWREIAPDVILETVELSWCVIEIWTEDI